MTLKSAIRSLRAKLGVDLDSERDISSDHEATDALMEGAAEASEDTCCLWTWNAPLTLTANEPEYSTLAAAVCPQRVFEIWGLYINGSWSTEIAPAKFQSSGYQSATAQSNPASFVLSGPSHFRFTNPPNAACVAGTSFAIGFRKHAIYNWNDHENSELEGVELFHRLIVLKTALNLSLGYVRGESALNRRLLFQQEYVQQSEILQQRERARHRKMVSESMAGLTICEVTFG